MNRRFLFSVVPVAAFFTCSLSTSGQVVNATGSYKGAAPGWDRGMESTMHCGNNPESWVRGSATLDKQSGALSMVVQLETDSVLAGPKGRVIASIRDAGGNLLYRATSDEIGIGGKPPGNVVIRNFSSTMSIPLGISSAANSISLDAECRGSITRLFNIDLGNITRSFDVVASNFREQSNGSPDATKLVVGAFSEAGKVSQPGTPEYTASLRKDMSVGSPDVQTQNVGTTSLDNDVRYRDNFSDQTRVWAAIWSPPALFRIP